MMTEIVKKSMGVKTNALDDDINMLIRACHTELRLSGVDVQNHEYSDIVSAAVINYCKAQMNYQGLSEGYQKMYVSQKMFLMSACRKQRTEGEQ